MPHLVKLCVLGSTGVGKTSLVEQLLKNNFDSLYRPTNQSGETSIFSVLMNSNLYQVKIIDMPMISYFPANSFYEWTDYRQCALRNANGYLLVFDLTSPGSFHYIKGICCELWCFANNTIAVIRDQLFESRNMQNIPVWIVGNKADLCMNVLASMRGHRDHHHHHTHQLHSHLHLHHHSAHEDMTPAFRELANIVKKHWKCSYIECSAKYNWRVVPLFRDIIKTIENTLSNTHDMHHHHREHHCDHSEGPLKHSTPVGGGQSGLSGAVRTLNNSTSNDNHRTCVIL